MKLETIEPSAPGGSTLTVFAEDVTGTFTMEAPDVPRTTPAGAVAQTLASRMGLPGSVAWTLRDDVTGQYLEEAVEIGRQVGPEARLTVTPKTHLG
jgi:hypothetical protein